jgi:hypothetical protein
MSQDCANRSAPPRCGCALTPTYNLDLWLYAFDTSPQDCIITTTEILQDSTTNSLTTPDVTIAGERVLSFGFGFTAAAAP